MSTTLPAAPTAKVAELSDQVIQQLFGDASLQFDLGEGTVIGLAGRRAVYLSADLIRGIHAGLEYETSDAWKIIMKNCGLIWGKRVAAQLRKDLRMMAKTDLGDLSVSAFIKLIEDYFSVHGWGKLEIHLEHAEAHGIVRASLHNSLFVDALSHIEGPVDYLVVGMLRGVFEAISGQNLDCIQIACSTTSPDQTCEFLVSGAERISVLVEPANQETSVDSAIQQLRAA